MYFYHFFYIHIVHVVECSWHVVWNIWKGGTNSHCCVWHKQKHSNIYRVILWKQYCRVIKFLHKFYDVVLLSEKQNDKSDNPHWMWRTIILCILLEIKITFLEWFHNLQTSYFFLWQKFFIFIFMMKYNEFESHKWTQSVSIHLHSWIFNWIFFFGEMKLYIGYEWQVYLFNHAADI